MATISGKTFPGISADRAARTILATWTGAVTGGTSNEVSLMQFHQGLLADSFTVDVVTTLNGGTVSGGKFTVELSYDGIHWIDSQAPETVIATTDGGMIAVSLSVYVAPASNKIPLFPARYARLKISTAVTVTGAPSFEAGITLR